MKKLFFCAALLLAAASTATAQYGGPRLFLDIPSMYITTPDVSKIGNRAGAGVDVAMNVGSHWSVARAGGGATFTLDPKAEDVGNSFSTNPFIFLEAGAGPYRTNGNQCAKSRQNAFTAIGKAGIRYDFQAKEVDYTLGAELGYFFIRDVFRNTEVVASANYLTQAQVVAVNFGFKFFLNLRANR